MSFVVSGSRNQSYFWKCFLMSTHALKWRSHVLNLIIICFGKTVKSEARRGVLVIIDKCFRLFDHSDLSKNPLYLRIRLNLAVSAYLYTQQRTTMKAHKVLTPPAVVFRQILNIKSDEIKDNFVPFDTSKNILKLRESSAEEVFVRRLIKWSVFQWCLFSTSTDSLEILVSWSCIQWSYCSTGQTASGLQ